MLLKIYNDLLMEASTLRETLCIKIDQSNKWLDHPETQALGLKLSEEIHKDHARFQYLLGKMEGMDLVLRYVGNE